MRSSLARTCLGVAFATLTAGISPSKVQYAAQLYPYCALSAANGATTCYFRSREECGRSCISDPWHIGAQRAWAYTRGGRSIDSRFQPPESRTPLIDKRS
jgi:hypothetical protein